MSIEITFSAQVQDPDMVFHVAEMMAEEWDLAYVQEAEGLRIDFCPLGNLILEAEMEEAAYRLWGSCQTSLGGPGLHHAVVSFLDELQRLSGMLWEVVDETEYYYHRNFLELQDQFHNWLDGLLNLCAENIHKTHQNFCVCWDVYQYQPQLPEQEYIITPFGAWQLTALLQWVEQHGIAAFARRFFLWYQQEHDGLFYRNVALHFMWEHCNFVTANRSQEDYQIQEQILDLLEKAMELDVTVPVPKKEYLLLCQCNLRQPVPLEQVTDLISEVTIGYRRGMVRWNWGYLHYTLPGNFLYQEDERGQQWSFESEDGWRAIRISGIEMEQEHAVFSQELFEEIPVETIKTIKAGDGLCRYGYMGLLTDDQYSCYQTVGQLICGRQSFLLIVSYLEEHDQQWADQFFQHVQGILPPQPETMELLAREPAEPGILS